MLETPYEAKVSKYGSELASLKVSSAEPQWSVNMKKALISTLKIQFPQESRFYSTQQNMVNNPRFAYAQKQQMQLKSIKGENPLSWTVMEEGIEGKCENTYQVSELPEYMIHDYEKGMINSALCSLVGNCESENTKQTADPDQILRFRRLCHQDPLLARRHQRGRDGPERHPLQH